MTRTVLLRVGQRTTLGRRYTLPALVEMAAEYNERTDAETRGRCVIEDDALVWEGPIQAQTGAMHFLPDGMFLPPATVDAISAALDEDGRHAQRLSAGAISHVHRSGELRQSAELTEDVLLHPDGSHETITGLQPRWIDPDEQRIGYRGDDSIPNPPKTGPGVKPARYFDGRPIAGLGSGEPFYFGDRRDYGPRGPFERPLPAEWHERARERRSFRKGALWMTMLVIKTLALVLLCVFAALLVLRLCGMLPDPVARMLALSIVVGMAFGNRRGDRPEQDERLTVQNRRTGSRAPSVVKTCRAEECKAPIVFLRYQRKTAAGLKEGTLPINLTPEAERRAALGEQWEPRHPELVSHHATCPAAERFRRDSAKSK